MGDWSSISAAITAVGDFSLGWLLALPRDVAIVALALLTSLVLTLVRKWCTDQELLGRCAADLRRLKQLLREAKSQQKPGEVQRMKGTASLIKLKQLGAEGRVLAVALLPLVFFGAWGMARLEYLPLTVSQEFTVRASYPQSSEGKLTHLVAPDGIELSEGSSPVQQVGAGDGDKQGTAAWVLAARRPVGLRELLIRHQDRTVTHALRVDGRVYEPPIQAHGEELILATEVELAPARFLGIVPGVPAIALPPWVVAYLLLALALVYPLRKLLRVW